MGYGIPPGALHNLGNDDEAEERRGRTIERSGEGERGGLFPAELSSEVAAELAQVVGEGYVDRSKEGRAWAMLDALGAYRLGDQASRAVLPLAVVRPGNTQEVSQVLRRMARHGVAVVARGAGSGVMGGAVPLVPSVVLDLSRLADVRYLCGDDLVEAGAGATLAEVNEALRPYRRMLGHDPWSVGMATVGGAISTNGMGYLAGRWGTMGDQVAAVEAVLADGTVVRTRLYGPAVGPDPKWLWVGSQGTLGIVTRAWLYARPLPPHAAFRTWRFGGFDAAYRAILALWGTGARYDLLDMSDDLPAALDVSPGMEDEWGRTALLHLGALGEREEVEGRMALAHRLLAQAGGQDLGPHRAQAYWEHRHDLAESYAQRVHRRRDLRAREQAGRLPLDYLNLAMRPSQIPAYRQEALRRLARQSHVAAGEAGIWCRPEVFSLVLHPRDAMASPAYTHRLLVELLALSLDMGGGIECIHGTGLKLLELVPADVGEAATVVRRLRKALDPQGLLNPGKWALVDQEPSSREGPQDPPGVGSG